MQFQEEEFGRVQWDVLRKEHGKRYEWELPERLIDQVAAGDKVMIRNTRGLRWVIVDVVEEYGACEHPLGLRMVIKKKGEPRNKN